MKVLSRAVLSLEALWGASGLCLFQLLVVAGFLGLWPHHSSLYLPLPLCVCVFPSSASYKDTSHWL